MLWASALAHFFSSESGTAFESSDDIKARVFYGGFVNLKKIHECPI